ncbi:MAG: glycosyltransferase family A protein [bacterium]|nr:glycosyltransferase family A protein [bacterium]
MLTLSVIIPTYNRKEVLERSLSALFDQTYPKADYEIIIINDGSTDGTEKLIEKIQLDSPVALKCFKQKKQRTSSSKECRNKECKRKNTSIYW